MIFVMSKARHRVRGHTRRTLHGVTFVPSHESSHKGARKDVRPTALELFAGAGGLALGLRQAGYRVVGMVEMNKHATNTLDAAVAGGHLEGVVLRGKVGDLNLSGFKGVGLLSGGPPCQPFSNAGKQRGRFDDRDGWPVVLDTVKQLQPRRVLMENVRGLMSAKFADYRAMILSRLHDLGYDARFESFNAKDANVPQDRERVFLLAWRHGEPEYKRPNAQDLLMTPREAMAQAGLMHNESDDLRPPVPSAANSRWLHKHPPTMVFRGESRPASTMMARHGSGSVNLAWTEHMQPGARVVLDDSDPNPYIARALNIPIESFDDPDFDPLYDEEGHEHVDHMSRRSRGRGVLLAEVVQNRGDVFVVRVNGVEEVWPKEFVRPTQAELLRLSPEGVAAMQDFPPGYPFQGGYNARGKQAGNAVPPSLAAHVLSGFPSSDGPQMRLFKAAKGEI